MASQYLSDFNTPSINGNIAKRVLANEILKGVAQGTIETNGRGVTQRFSNDTSGAQIQITQFMPFNQEARELGATINGENFDGTTALQATTNGLGVDVITVINRNIDIPQVTQDMLPIDILGGCMYNLTMDINNNINAMTIGGKIVATFNAVYNETMDFQTITKASATGEEWKQALITMNTLLDDGDADNGLGFFPDNDRCYVFKTSILPYLFKSGAIILGASNYGQEMLAKGGISPGATQDNASGYIGEFVNVPCYKATTLLWRLAAKYAGVPVWSLDNVHGYVSSGYANVRALAQNEQVKIIDSPDGAGVRLQPNFRMGFKSLYAKGNIFLVETGYTNPSTGSLALKAPKSRSISSATTLSAVTFGGASASWDATDGRWEISVINTVETGVIAATATAGSVAKVVVPSGTQAVEVGTNDFTISVTAEDGTKATYTLQVTRAGA